MADKRTALRRRPQLSEEVASHVRHLVMSGEVSPGDFIRLDETAA
ncbi:MAG: GntR family transcriptional regulator, partial [Rhodococcus sp.]|nr:GntR family transcriptional regulator [Rhodococcus sp. (in: high G+C Gram-positive bacteria)]